MEEAKGSKYIIEEAPINITIINLVIPALLGSIVAQLNFILDTFFLSQVIYEDTTVLLAATAAAFPILLFMLAFANLFGIGGSIYGTKFLGSGDTQKARSIFSLTFVSAVIFNIILTVVIFIALNPILKSLGATSPAVLKYAQDYTAIMLLGSFTIILNLVLVMFARSEGKAKLVLFTIIFQIFLNIVLNWLFIIPLEMATIGASLATVISQFSQFLILIVFLFSPKSEFRYLRKFRKNVSKIDLKNILMLGFPATLGILILTLSSGILQYQASFFNDEELVASIGILIKFLTMFTMLTQASASGIQPVFSYSYGSKNKERFQETFKRYFQISTIISIVIGIYLILVPNSFVNFLSLTGDTAIYVKIGTYGIGIMVIVMPSSFLMQVLFQSINRAIISMRIVIIRQFIVFVFLTFIFTFLFGKTGLLLSQQFSIVIGSFVTFILYKKLLFSAIDQEFL